MDPEQDLVIVSMHERGFPQADFYQGMAKYDACEFRCIGAVPDSWMSLGNGDSLEKMFDAARKQWPTAMIVPAEEEDDDDTEAGDGAR